MEKRSIPEFTMPVLAEIHSKTHEGFDVFEYAVLWFGEDGNWYRKYAGQNPLTKQETVHRWRYAAECLTEPRLKVVQSESKPIPFDYEDWPY